jgi:hypothetical protein
MYKMIGGPCNCQVPQSAFFIVLEAQNLANILQTNLSQLKCTDKFSGLDFLKFSASQNLAD